MRVSFYTVLFGFIFYKANTTPKRDVPLKSFVPAAHGMGYIGENGNGMFSSLAHELSYVLEHYDDGALYGRDSLGNTVQDSENVFINQYKSYYNKLGDLT